MQERRPEEQQRFLEGSGSGLPPVTGRGSERFSWKRGLFIAGVYTASFALGTSILLVSGYALKDIASLDQFTKNSVSMLSALIASGAVFIASARRMRG